MSRVSNLSKKRMRSRAKRVAAPIETLESRRLLSVSGAAALLGSSSIDPYDDVQAGTVDTKLSEIAASGTNIIRLHVYPGEYYSGVAGQGGHALTTSQEDQVMLACYDYHIQPTILFEYYTSKTNNILLSNYDWNAIGQTFATRYEAGGTFDQAQQKTDPNFNMSFGIKLYQAINEPDEDNPTIPASDYATALQDLATGVHSVNSSLDVVAGGYANPSAAGRNSGLSANLQPLINAVAPLLNNGTLDGIDLHTYYNITYNPMPGAFPYGAYSNFLKVKNDAVPKITANVPFYASEFNYQLNGTTENTAAQGMLTGIWDNLGVVGSDGATPVTQLALPYTLLSLSAEDPANPNLPYDTTNGTAAQITPWAGTARGQTVQLVAQLTNGMSWVSADPSKTGTYVLQNTAAGSKLWVWQDVQSWTNELGTSFTVTNIPSGATELQVYGWNGLRSTILLSGQTSYTVTGLPGSETYMFLATTTPVASYVPPGFAAGTSSPFNNPTASSTETTDLAYLMNPSVYPITPTGYYGPNVLEWDEAEGAGAPSSEDQLLTAANLDVSIPSNATQLNASFAFGLGPTSTGFRQNTQINMNLVLGKVGGGTAELYGVTGVLNVSGGDSTTFQTQSGSVTIPANTYSSIQQIIFDYNWKTTQSGQTLSNQNQTGYFDSIQITNNGTGGAPGYYLEGFEGSSNTDPFPQPTKSPTETTDTQYILDTWTHPIDPTGYAGFNVLEWDQAEGSGAPSSETQTIAQTGLNIPIASNATSLTASFQFALGPTSTGFRQNSQVSLNVVVGEPGGGSHEFFGLTGNLNVVSGDSAAFATQSGSTTFAAGTYNSIEQVIINYIWKTTQSGQTLSNQNQTAYFDSIEVSSNGTGGTPHVLLPKSAKAGTATDASSSSVPAVASAHIEQVASAAPLQTDQEDSSLYGLVD